MSLARPFTARLGETTLAAKRTPRLTSGKMELFLYTICTGISVTVLCLQNADDILRLTLVCTNARLI